MSLRAKASRPAYRSRVVRLIARQQFLRAETGIGQLFSEAFCPAEKILRQTFSKRPLAQVRVTSIR
jgi:hypothetical protein